MDYCAFDMPYKKSTDLWTSLKDWNPSGSTGNGRCNDGHCKQGMRKSNGHWNHRQRIGGPAHLQPKGPNVKKLLWRLPQKLTHEFTEQLKQTQKNGEQKVVIDFFSGGESWKTAMEEAGYTAYTYLWTSELLRRQQSSVQQLRNNQSSSPLPVVHCQ